MAPSHHPQLPKAPQPTKVFFDPYNSASTGHQRAANRLSGSTSWRESRQHKLAHQFNDRTGGGGGKFLSDLVGAGGENFRKDGRKDNGDWEPGAPGLREKGWQDIREVFASKRKRLADNSNTNLSGKKQRTSLEPPISGVDDLSVPGVFSLESPGKMNTNERAVEKGPCEAPEEDEPPQIFKGLTMYLNGSTMPLVSDHRLRQLWVQHGGNTSLALGRRTVTHIILAEQGAGGGLAAGKIQKENTNVRGKGIKFVTAKWILDSIDKGVRQPESRYTQAELKDRLGGAGQKSVAAVFCNKGN